jgi:hypothetical protein
MPEVHSTARMSSICQVKANEVGGTCGTHGRGEECTSIQGFDGKARRKETTGKTKA